MPEERIGQVAVGAVDRDAVEADGARIGRAAGEAGNHIDHIFVTHRFGRNQRRLEIVGRDRGETFARSP